MTAITPPNSRNVRYHCARCREYIAEDATRPLGFLALPLSAVRGGVPEQYRPNHHIFYADRVVDATDALPKWRTLVQGEQMDGGTVGEIIGGGGGSSGDTSGSAGGAVPATTSVDAAAASALHDAATGRFRKDVLPLSPTRPPYPGVYHFTETDPIANHVTSVAPEKVAERVARKYLPSPGAFVAPTRTTRDVVIVGGGHNALTAAAYLAKAGLDVLVLERRHVVGGAAVTEELTPGFKFSRASYLAGLLRPSVIDELRLHDYGFKYLPRDPSSFTPTPLDGVHGGKALMLGGDEARTWASVAQFSVRDADALPRYEEFMGRVRDLVQPIIDGPPPSPGVSVKDWRRVLRHALSLGGAAWQHRDVLVPFYELFTAPATHILDRWFESEILKTTLATDAVIGATGSPTHPGSAYLLLHHVMGEAAGRKGVWSYVEGGMGAISEAIAAAARAHGAEIAVNATVAKILYSGGGGASGGALATARGVRMADGTEVIAKKAVLVGCTPYHAFLELLPGLARDSGTDEESPLPRDFQHHIRFHEQGCGAFKINCAVDRLPEFACMPNPPGGVPGPQHMGTTHFESTMQELEHAWREASVGIPATRPVIEMTIPSALDRTISPPGKHVVQFFVNFAPYDVDPKIGNWGDVRFKEGFADRVFRIVDEYCPGFSSSVLYRDVLSPLDLERIFGLHKGNIQHGSLALHQLAGYSSHRMPMNKLYLCGSGAHPGGGVQGAPGRNCASVVLSDL